MVGKRRKIPSLGTCQQLSDKANKKEVEQHKAKKPKDVTEAEKPNTTVVTRAAGRKAKSSAILTRAARRKAGIPPPTPLFRGVTRDKTENTCSSRASQREDTSSSSSSSSDEDESVKPLWVQCDYKSCQKWRKLLPGTKIDLDEDWYCCMHPDSAYQSCDAPEEKCQSSRKRAFTFSRLAAGQLVWARLSGFPPWPALVSPDPWSDGTFISEDRIGCIYHVEFLGKMRTHSWMPEEQIEPYHCRSMCSLGPIRKSKQLDYALSEAESFISLTDSERLSKLEYTENSVNVEDSQHSSLASTSNGKQPQIRKGATSDTGAKKKQKTTTTSYSTEAKNSKPLTDKTNRVTIKQENPYKKGSRQLDSSVGAKGANTHEDLFKTLGMAFGDDNRINLVATSIMKQIQSQIVAALNTSGQTKLVLTGAENTKVPVVQHKVASTAPRVAGNDGSVSKVKLHQHPKQPRESPTSRLTQTSMEFSPDNQVKLVTTKKVKGHRNARVNVRRKRKSPLQQSTSGTGRGCKTRKTGTGSPELISPSIRDYFKPSPPAGTSHSARGESVRQVERGSATITHVCHVPSDQEVPIAGSSAFHSLELEAESELQEIQNMLSMFDDAPALESEKPVSTLGQCGQRLTRIDEKMKRNSDRKAPVVVPSTKSNTSVPLTVDKRGNERGNTDKSLSTGRDEDSLDIETVLQEMGNIEDLLQDLSQAQVVPY